MGDHTAVQRLIEILTAYYSEGRPLEEDLNFFITSEFLQNLKGVLLTKQLVSQRRWQSYFDICYYKMQSTPEMYLRYIIYACRQGSRIHLNIFERFLGAFAIILHFRVVKFGEPAVNFSKLIPDTFMGLYETEIKKPFRKFGGFRRFVEYINDPKYLASNLISKKDFNQKSFKYETPLDLDKQVMKALSKEKQLPENFQLENAQNDWSSVNLAQKILKKAKFELPSLPSNVSLESKLPQQLKEQSADEKPAIEAKEMGFQLYSISSDVLKKNFPVLHQQILGQLADEKAFEAKRMSFQLPAFPSKVMKEKLPVLPQQMLEQSTDEKAFEAEGMSFQLPSFSSEIINEKLPVLLQQVVGKLADEKAFEAKGILHSFPRDVMKAKSPVLPQQMLEQLAEKVLKASDRHLELPSYFSDADVKMKLPEQVAEKAMDLKVSALKVELDRSMNLDSETDFIERLMNIVQTILQHNHSISSDQANQINPLQKKACEILEHLRGKIETLIELLDEYDKE